MKKLFVTILLMLPLATFAQTSTANPDTVCYQSAALSTYSIPSAGAGTYTWTVAAPGVITAGQGTNSISVNWSAAAPGLINNGVSVSFTSATGCPATPVNLNVLIYQVVPTITPIGPFCQGDPCVNLVGSPAGGTWSGVGVVGNQFCPGAANSTITYTYTNGGCTFTATTGVTVAPTPVLSPIQHN